MQSKNLSEDKRKNLLFLKKLEEIGLNMQISESCKKIVGINDDLENAIKFDM